MHRSTPAQHCMGRLSLSQPPARVDLPAMPRDQDLQPPTRVDLPTPPKAQHLQPLSHGEPARLHHKLTMEDIRPSSICISMGVNSLGSMCQLVWPLLAATNTTRMGPPGWLMVLLERLRSQGPQLMMGPYGPPPAYGDPLHSHQRLDLRPRFSSRSR
jgi:hypothetical protein